MKIKKDTEMNFKFEGNDEDIYLNMDNFFSKPKSKEFRVVNIVEIDKKRKKNGKSKPNLF